MATIHTFTPRHRVPSEALVARSSVEGALAYALDTVDHMIAVLDSMDSDRDPGDRRGAGLDLPATEAPSRIDRLCQAGRTREPEHDL